MHTSIGKILPADGYKTIKTFDLSAAFYEALYQLYQPVIGIEALSLYMTLYHQIAFADHHSHHYLMQLLNQSLTSIYEARQKIEAIGLLETFCYEDGNQTRYDLYLKKPMTPSEFMNDDVLSQMLYHQIGKQKFQSLKMKIIEKDAFITKGKEVTKTFSDVFLHNPESLGMEIINDTAISENQTQSLERSEEVVFIDKEVVDFVWLSQNLKDRMLKVERILTPDNKKFINQMAALYNLASSEVDKLLHWSINAEHMLDREAFKEACLDALDVLPSKKQLITQRDRIKTTAKNRDKDQQTMKEQFIERMETISPKELLEDLSGGAKASAQDLKMIAEVMEKQQLNAGVMNVLIHYVMLKLDMKLTKAYLDKIAAHWSRKQIKTVKDAMALAKEEHKSRTAPKKTYPHKKGTRVEVLPDWFKEQQKNTPEQTKETDLNEDALEELDALMKSFKSRQD